MQNILRNVSIIVWGQMLYLSSIKSKICLEFAFFFDFCLEFELEKET